MGATPDEGARRRRARWPDARDVCRLAGGLTSQAFGFRHGETDLVTRINPSDAGFRKDACASRRFAGPALPVPEVMDIGRLDAGHALCISRRAPGRPLHELAAAGAERAAGPWRTPSPPSRPGACVSAGLGVHRVGRRVS